MMRKTFGFAALAVVAMTGAAEARDQINIVGSSTVYQFIIHGACLPILPIPPSQMDSAPFSIACSLGGPCQKPFSCIFA